MTNKIMLPLSKTLLSKYMIQFISKISTGHIITDTNHTSNLVTVRYLSLSVFWVYSGIQSVCSINIIANIIIAQKYVFDKIFLNQIRKNPNYSNCHIECFCQYYIPVIIRRREASHKTRHHTETVKFDQTVLAIFWNM